MRDCDVTFIVVSTPSEAEGGFSLRYVLPCAETIGKVLRTKRGFHLVVLTSTVMPGSTGGEVILPDRDRRCHNSPANCSEAKRR